MPCPPPFPHTNTQPTQAILGLTTAYTFGLLTGAGALGFLIGSSVGFVGGVTHFYFVSKREALMALWRYPGLMGHHLAGGFSFLLVMGGWKGEWDGGLWEGSGEKGAMEELG